MLQNTETSKFSENYVDNVYGSDLDDENYSSVESSGIRERRRKLHTEAEQRRRNAIKRGFEGLLGLVHPVKSDCCSLNVRMSKSTILHKGNQNSLKSAELESLEKEVKALRILNVNYENMVKSNSVNYKKSIKPVPEHIRLKVFQLFADSLFTSFDSMLTLTSFPDLSSCIINWTEENCKSECISSIMNSVLFNIFDQFPVVDTCHNEVPNGFQSDPTSKFQFQNVHAMPNEYGRIVELSHSKSVDDSLFYKLVDQESPKVYSYKSNRNSFSTSQPQPIVENEQLSPNGKSALFSYVDGLKTNTTANSINSNSNLNHNHNHHHHLNNNDNYNDDNNNNNKSGNLCQPECLDTFGQLSDFVSDTKLSNHNPQSFGVVDLAIGNASEQFRDSIVSKSLYDKDIQSHCQYEKFINDLI